MTMTSMQPRWAALAALVLLACGAPPPATRAEPSAESAGGETPSRLSRRLAHFTRYAPMQTGLTPAQRASIDRNCPFGAPLSDPAWGHGPSQIVARGGYALRHSAVDLIPLWVCEGLERAQVDGPLGRPETDPFAPDPELPAGQRAELTDYRGSGYDRGHMAPSADQTVDAQLQAETYYLSNMAPQQGVGFNQHIWARLESLARDWIREAGRGFILTGPIFWDPNEDDATTADGYVEYVTVGDNGVAVPTHFFKVVVVPGEGDDAWRAIAFVLENRRHSSPDRFGDRIVSIDWIEERTGLDLLPELDPLQQQTLEAQPSPMWPNP